MRGVNKKMPRAMAGHSMKLSCYCRRSARASASMANARHRNAIASVGAPSR